MDSTDSYTFFKNSIVNEIRELRGLSLLRTPEIDSLEPWQESLDELGARVAEAEKNLALLKAKVAKEMLFVEKAKQLKAKADEQQSEIAYIQSHLPARLPGKHAADMDGAPPAHKSLAEAPQTQQTTTTTTTNTAPTLPTSLSSSSLASKEDAKKAEPAAKKPAASSTPNVPNLSYVTVNEFEGTPKYVGVFGMRRYFPYMKGRLTLDKLNTAIDEFQKLLQAKYKVLAMNPSKLLDKNLKKYKTYKEAETNETKGLFFVTDADMAESVSLRQGDATGKAVIAVLRHLHRIKDLGGTTKRYAVQVQSSVT